MKHNSIRIPKSAFKTKEEIDLIAESCRIVAETLVLLKDYVKPGITTLELDKIGEDYIRSQDGIPAFKGYAIGNLVFPNSICISVNDEIIHGIPSKRVLEEGDIVSLDCGVVKNGYYGDSAITYSVGEIEESEKLLLKVTEEALMLGIKEATVGKNLYQLSGAIQNHVEKHGFSLTREYCGHGLGRNLHEFPSIPNFVPALLHRNQYPNVKFFENMVIAIEPMVHIGKKETKLMADKWTVVTKDGSRSAHFEHTIVITKEEPIILTKRN